MEKSIIVGIDFSKKTFNAAILRPSKERRELFFIAEKEFTNDIDGADAFTNWVNDAASLRGDFSDVLVGGEDTGSYSMLLPRVLCSLSIACSLQNPLAIKNGVGKIVRGKSDPADARMIAEYFWRYQDSVRLYEPETKTTRSLREKYTLRKTLSNIMVRYKNLVKESECRLQAYPDCQDIMDSIKFYSGEVSRLKKKIKKIDKELEKIVESDEEFSKLSDRLTSIPGIGKLTAVLLIVITRGFSRFDNAKQLASFCGVAPHLHQSGTSLQKGAHRSRYADPTISGLLHMVALTAITHDSKMMHYAERKKMQGKPFLVIMNNVKNKILTMAYSIATKNTLYDPNFLEKVTPEIG